HLLLNGSKGNKNPPYEHHGCPFRKRQSCAGNHDFHIQTGFDNLLFSFPLPVSSHSPPVLRKLPQK
ncbi:MAG: hypothetical protein ACI4FV_03745, partial [Lachnospiraceae bacterium]